MAPALWLVLAFVAATSNPADAQYVKLDRCDLATIQAGKPTEITLHGGGLEGVDLWTSFPATVERLDEKTPRFRITTDFEGPAAIRAHSEKGVSNLCYLTVNAAGHAVIDCAKKTRPEDAQLLHLPAFVHGTTPERNAHYYRFAATGGRTVQIIAESRNSDFDGVITVRSSGDGKRLAQADDSEIYGTDPWMRFVPPADGEYLLELIDSEYRGGKAFQVRIGEVVRQETIEEPPGIVVHDESEPVNDEIREVRVGQTLRGAFEVSGDRDSFSFDLAKRSFVEIWPRARLLRSPVTPRLRLTNSAGKTIAETPADAFDERPLRTWLEKGNDYIVTISEAFGRHGAECRYLLELDGSAIPFELGVPHQNDKKHPLHDKALTVPGGLFEFPVTCKRHEFTPEVALQIRSIASFESDRAVIGENQDNATLRFRMPSESAPGQLWTLAVRGIGQEESGTYETGLSTRSALKARDPKAAIPVSAANAVAVRVVAPPVKVEVTPPDEITIGGALPVPVKLVWHDEQQKFNSTLSLTGLPPGVHSTEAKLDTKNDSTGLELKAEKPDVKELKNLRVQARLEYHGQALLVESEPFSIRITEKDENN